jgi:hypothetical protein
MSDDAYKTCWCCTCWTVYRGKTPQEAADRARACSESHDRR